MGIPGFNTWFSTTHVKAYTKLENVKVDHLYIDMNSVLHLVLRKARNMEHFHMSLYAKLDLIVNAANPRKSVLFALDGPAPLAKLLTQRSRRKKAALTDAMKKGKVVSSLAITPGTIFMQDVHDSLAYYICQRLLSRKFSHLHYELSGSTVQGEGEVKILGRLQRPLDHMAPDDSHAIVGNDSDLILMALLTDAPSLYVFGQILLQDPPPPSRLKVLSVDILHKLWKNLGPPAEEDAEAELQRLRGMKQDLALTCILGKGNDYLPSVPGVTLQRFDGMGDEDGLWQTYLRMRKSPKYLKRALAFQSPDGSTALDEDFLYHLLQAATGPVSPRVVTPNLKAPEPDLYLEGLCWVLDMYRGGVCPDYRFCYDGLGPSSKELCEAIIRRKKDPRIQQKRLQTRAEIIKAKKGQKKKQGSQKQRQPTADGNSSKAEPLKPVVCAMAMLPAAGQDVAPTALRHLMNENSAIHDMYTDCQVCEDFSVESSELQFQMAQLSRQRLLLNEKIFQLDNKKDQKIEKELAQLTKELDLVKDKIRISSAKRQQHLEKAHPYEPFAIHRIEKAVDEVPLSKYPANERQLATFGNDYIYRRLDGNSAAAGYPLRMHHSKRGKQPKTERLKKPPQPPAEKFKPLRTPLPIMRFLRSPVEPHDVFARLARNIVTFAKGKL